MQPLIPGQVWTYRTRPGEYDSRILICKVEPDATHGQIVHIHVRGLRVKSRHAARGHSETIGHMPFAVDALRKDLVRLETFEGGMPAWEEGYQEWRKAMEAGKGGVWTCPIADAIAWVESTLSAEG